MSLIDSTRPSFSSKETIGVETHFSQRNIGTRTRKTLLVL